MRKKIVAFLQNPWFKPGISARYVAMYCHNQEFHRRVLSLSATGRALRQAFGDELYQRIHWDNANPLHGDTTHAVFPANVNHILWVVINQRPDIILLFGKQAQDGWDKLVQLVKFATVTTEEFLGELVVLRSAHPMARGSAARHLEKIAQDLKKLIF